MRRIVKEQLMPGAKGTRFYHRRFFHNWISYTGTVLALLAFTSFLFLLIFHIVGGAIHAPYGALVIFIFVPAFLILGLLLIPFGMVFEWWRWKQNKAPSISKYPTINLNLPRHRKILGIVSGVTLVVVFLSVFGTYRAYRYTESVAFCGTLCHRVMQPQYVSHAISPHAHVRCVDCHVGPGIHGYVLSKMRGIHQLYQVAADSYPRPIPAPISLLRPQRFACEKCHWPAKFFGDQELKTVHYLPDKQNTRWDITLLLKVGGGGPWNPRARGIHWHASPDTRIEYVATDRQLQHIPWVRYTNLKTGKSLVFTTPNAPSPQAIKKMKVLTMDCMDCHNRPTHVFHSPRYLLNSAMAAGYVDPSLPDVKKEGVTLLASKYPSRKAGMKGIATGLRSYYRKNYPQVAKQKAAAISQAVKALQKAYRENFFPYMKERWNTYANNLGHLDSPGCYRCHDGNHKTASGKVISKNCTLCHTIIAQGTPGKLAYSTQPGGLTFHHPKNIDGLWHTVNCSRCHNGTIP